jgi:hypothetical protein
VRRFEQRGEHGHGVPPWGVRLEKLGEQVRNICVPKEAVEESLPEVLCVSIAVLEGRMYEEEEL